jgi:hypothetical protein
MGLILGSRFLLWFLIGAGVTGYLLYKRSRDPWFGALAAGVIGGVGGVVMLALVWIWIWYFMPPGVPTVIKLDNRDRKRFRIKW